MEAFTFLTKEKKEMMSSCLLTERYPPLGEETPLSIDGRGKSEKKPERRPFEEQHRITRKRSTRHFAAPSYYEGTTRMTKRTFMVRRTTPELPLDANFLRP